MRIGIDATNIGGGGGVTHLKEIIANFDSIYFKNKISKLIVFSSQEVLDEIPDLDILEKLTFPELNGGLLSRIKFQMGKFDQEINERCDILFSITGDYIGSFRPLVGMSRNMLLYERDIWREIKQPKEIIRFWLNYKKQKRCFENSGGIIFISEYAKKIISNKLDLTKKEKTVIHHGVAPKFMGKQTEQKHISNYSFSSPFKFLYVSTVHTYKNQSQVVEAIANLRQLGYPIEISLVGGVIFRPAGVKLEKTIKNIDPRAEFIYHKGHIDYKQMELEYRKADGIIFASTCENMPNILMESMASGLPIACSNKQPMPEFLKETDFYFDAKNPQSISKVLKAFLENPEKRKEQISNNIREINNYSWQKTSKETFNYLISIEKNQVVQG